MTELEKKSLSQSASKPKLVGQFLKKKREALGLSQRALGQLFEPAVTTQFISNVERGVTPLPPAHIPTLCHALKISEDEMMQVLEQEYAAKLMGRVGIEGANGKSQALLVEDKDLPWMKAFYQAVLDVRKQNENISLDQLLRSAIDRLSQRTG